MNISISTRVTPDLKELVKAHSVSNSISMSEVVRRALEMYLQEVEEDYNSVSYAPSITSLIEAQEEYEASVQSTTQAVAEMCDYSKEGYQEFLQLNNTKLLKDVSLPYQNSVNYTANKIKLALMEVPELTEEYLAPFEACVDIHSFSDEHLLIAENHLNNLRDAFHSADEGVFGSVALGNSEKSLFSEKDIRLVDALIEKGILNAYRTMHFDYLHSEMCLISYYINKEFINMPEFHSLVFEKMCNYESGASFIFDRALRMEFRHVGACLDATNSWKKIAE